MTPDDDYMLIHEKHERECNGEAFKSMQESDFRLIMSGIAIFLLLILFAIYILT